MPPIPVPMADAVALVLVARLEFPAPADGGPSLAAGAAWIDRIAPALRHAGVDLSTRAEVFVRVAAVRPGAAGAAASASDYDPAIIGRVADAVAALQATDRPRPQVAVHEEWRPVGEARIEVALYARPGGC